VLRIVRYGIVVVVLSLAVGEALTRLVLDPGDVLNPDMLRQPQFGVMIAPNARGHDRWGFRNSAVPAHVDVLALGDSMTYGTYATREEAWPSVLAHEAHVTVYNAGMGGWGPSQYACAMRVYGRVLHPKAVVIGLYLGDDIRQAAAEDYPCSELDPERIEAGQHIAEDDAGAPLGRLRRWLNHHSVLYQATKRALSGSSWFPRIAMGQRNVGWVQVSGHSVPVRIDNEDGDFWRTGIDKAISLLASIGDECAGLDAKCYVVLIPSREGLFFPLLDQAKTTDVGRSLGKVWTVERTAAEDISRAFAGSRLTVLNTTADLSRAALAGMPLYPIGIDPHFNANGYRVIGSFVASHARTGE
jgi:hypothetical protein